ncbi:MAG TPA: cob(I)yrinic acid a,c-diamide adenosyltransferase [Candidatus Paceibacterota bacterium]|nr:cob(I)yrinic acid a,c-diamide adenosyltransferase [Candidatus Paceibacterota bacterium]
MLYTGKGDDGTTSAFGSKVRFSKNSSITEALGTLDEINSFLGLIKVHKQVGLELGTLIGNVQNNLFIAQAETAGADKNIAQESVTEIEQIINDIETTLPPVKTFFVSGGTELGALFDVARTIARRAERRMVAVHDEGILALNPSTLAYLNRLSSLLYALARQSNHRAGISEESPTY